MAQFTFFDEVKRYLGEAAIDLTNHNFKAMLTNTAPNFGTNALKADIVEIAAGNGYVAGGMTMTGVTWAETGAGTGIWRWNMNDFTWNAAGGNIGAFRWIVWYDDTTAAPLKPLIGAVDYGVPITLTDGNGFTVDIGLGGVLELS